MAREKNTQPQAEAVAEAPGLMSRLRTGGAIVAAAALVLFLLQNLQRVTVHFLWFSWDTRMLFALLIAAFFGVISSVLAVIVSRDRKR